MAKEFHMAKPFKIFSGDNMDVYIQCDYPYECFGAPKYYVAYLNYKDKEIVLDGREDINEFINELYRWKDNHVVYKLIKNDIKQFKKVFDINNEWIWKI